MLLILSVFVPWPFLRMLKDDLHGGLWSLIALLPTSLIVLFYAGQQPAGRAIFSLVGAFGLLRFVVDVARNSRDVLEAAPLGKAALLSTILFAPLAYLAFTVDGWRAFGWHNLLQTEAIYSVFLNNGQDYGFASHPLGYPYLGLLPVGVVSQSLDIAPTKVFLSLNFLALLVWVYSLQSFLDERDDSSWVGNGIALLTVVFLSGSSLYAAEKLLYYAGFGNVNIEFRASPVTTKFIHLDAMTWGIASLSVQYYLLASRAFKDTRAGVWLSTVFGLQAIVTYPLLGPCSIAIAGVQALEFDQRGRPTLAFRRLFGPVVLAIGLVGVLGLYATDAGARSLSASSSATDVLVQALNGLAVVAFVLGLAAIGMIRQPIAVRARVLLLCTALLLAFAILRLPFEVQYKFLYGMLIVLLFYAPAALLDLSALVMKGQGTLRPVAITTVLGVSLAFYGLQEAKHLPPLTNRFSMIEDSWLIDSPHSMAIKRAMTEARVPLSETVLLTDAREPLVLFLRVPLYYYVGRFQVGYSMDYKLITTDVKAYSPSQFEHRRALSERVLKRCQIDDLSTETLTWPANRFLVALAADNVCRPAFAASAQMRKLISLDDGIEVFVQTAKD